MSDIQTLWYGAGQRQRGIIPVVIGPPGVNGIVTQAQYDSILARLTALEADTYRPAFMFNNARNSQYL
jgi:hypothetical protein